MSTPSSATDHCYCGAHEAEQYMLDCQKCRKLFHLRCLTSGRPSEIVGDTYFSFTCSLCSPTNSEIIERSKMYWTHAILLTLYNLQLQGGGKCGYYRWRDICTYIDRHWNTLFGNTRIRRKNSTWQGTVAGTLSANCPQLFRSGTAVLGESGWWALTNATLPTPAELDVLLANQKVGRKSKSSLQDSSPKVEGLRHRSTKPAIQAAMELKERRSVLQEAKDIRKTRQPFSDEYATSSSMCKLEERDLDDCKMSSLDNYDCVIPESSPNFNINLNILHSDDMTDIKTEIPHLSNETLNVECSRENMILTDVASEEIAMTEGNLFKDDDIPLIKEEIIHETDITDLSYLLHTEDDVDFDIDRNAISSPSLLHHPELPAVEDLLSTFSCIDEKPIETIEPVDIKEEIELEDDKQMEEKYDQIYESDEDSSMNNQPCATTVPEVGRKRKAVIKEEPKETELPKLKCQMMNVHQEQQILKRLESMPNTLKKYPALRRLKHKLSLRKLKRERGIPIFNIDTKVQSLYGMNQSENGEKTDYNYTMQTVQKREDNSILDRYQTGHYVVCGTSHRSLNFVTRLMGLEEERESIISPYTARVLKPYIFRDYETVPKKLKLLREIVARYHRNDPNWKPPPNYPIDYCYVRPQHVVIVNSICREYFWPGIDLSECLQYPDFSCIALYRKVIIGFAFMVPDVKCNEAYISFIFTHPEWRGAGIATFMLYHLIQTCMGKDVTLHVSAANPALLLYQKFGFKIEEFILDFYNNYFPFDSKECRHAMFLRLSR